LCDCSENRYILTPMLPGSDCGYNEICYRDQCVTIDASQSYVFNGDTEANGLDLTAYCSSDRDRPILSTNQRDTQMRKVCVNWEDDFLCHPSRSCPNEDDTSIGALYIKHMCCRKCSPNADEVSQIFSRTRSIEIRTIRLLVTMLSIVHYTRHA
jgi:hypothetical protein